MPIPTPKDLHVDRLLTNISVGYRNANYIADQVFPIVPVQKQGDRYAVYNKSYWFRDEAKLRAPGAVPDVGGYTVGTSNTYFCQEYAISKAVTDEERANADAPFTPDQTATQYVTDKLQLRRENAFATDFFVASAWATSSTGNTADFTQWSNYGASSPIVNLDFYKDAVEGAIAVEPNKLVLGKAVWVQLKNHPDFIDLIKYTQKAVLTEDLFASLAGFDQVLIGRALVTTTAEGTAEASVTYSRVWGKSALLVYVTPSPSLQSPSAGYTFVWQAVPGAIQFIRRERDERARTDFITGGSYFDQRVIANDAGTILTAAVA